MLTARIGVIALLVCLVVTPASSELTQPGVAATPPWKYTVMHQFGNVPLHLNRPLRATDGNFYATSKDGGSGDDGAVVKITPAGVLTVLHWFSGGEDGADPSGSLIQATDGNFYGTTTRGGSHAYGTIFKITPAGVFTTLYGFYLFEFGGYPSGIIQASDGYFYGTTSLGGPYYGGTIYRMTPDGTMTWLYTFGCGVCANALSPEAALVEGADHEFYGTTRSGGPAGKGTVFRITHDGTFSILHSFAGGSDGDRPMAPLIQATDGNLYGTTAYGGPSDLGTIFKVPPVGGATIVHAFAGGADGARPETPLLQASDGNFYGTASFGGGAFVGSVFKMTPAGVLTTLYSFPSNSPERYPSSLLQSGPDLYGTTSQSANNGGGALFMLTTTGTYSVISALPQHTGGSTPLGRLMQASNGLLYGTTADGGPSDVGTVFNLTTAGVLTQLLAFDSSVTGGGMFPETGLLQAADGNLYGTTREYPTICLQAQAQARAAGCGPTGTLFRLTTAGVLTYLHQLSVLNEGAGPAGPLVQGTDANFYGTTGYYGPNGSGTAFRMAPDGTLTVLHAFHFAGESGANPRGGLIRGTDGNFYGTASSEGLIGGLRLGHGTVFRMTPAGAVTVLHTFNGDDGAEPYGELVQGSDGAFYGTTRVGGATSGGVAYKVTAGGAFNVLHYFGDGTDGANPYGALLLASDGHFYGTTRNGGASNLGTIFSMTGAGVVTVRHSFSGADGSRPQAGLLQATDGRFYGTTTRGGATESGVVFRLRLTAPFTDEPLSANSSAIRAVHITELRARINLVRAAWNLPAYSFEDPTLVSGAAMIRAQHIQDLRAALHQAYVAAGLPPPTYTDPSLTIGTVAKAVHIAELRSAVTALE